MSFLDTIKSAVGGLAGQNNDLTTTLKTLSTMLEKQGGVQGLVQTFQNGGLGEIAKSWVGTGANLPITPEQIQKVLGSDTVMNLANQMGVSTTDISQKLSVYLPQIIDKLTPNGQVSSEPVTTAQLIKIGTSLLTK